jgi:hypothetical protein
MLSSKLSSQSNKTMTLIHSGIGKGQSRIIGG